MAHNPILHYIWMFFFNWIVFGMTIVFFWIGFGALYTTLSRRTGDDVKERTQMYGNKWKDFAPVQTVLRNEKLKTELMCY